MNEELQARLPARLILVLGVAMIAGAIALAVRTYMPCPFWDEWAKRCDCVRVRCSNAWEHG